MIFQKKVMSSAVISAIGLILSIALPIIPCRIGPSVPNPIYKWKLCSLNPDQVPKLNSIQEYFGYTTSIMDSYFIVLLIVFVVSMLFFHFTTKNKK